MCSERDDRTHAVLARALNSPSRTLRLRAVLMLASVQCADRDVWLERAARDRDPAVRDAATIVGCWVATPGPTAEWPDREALREADAPTDLAEAEFEAALDWRWEYAIEVWRDDGLLIGVFLSTACAEDDDHARSVALGQAILSASAGEGDSFDPATAATFIVGKRRTPRRAGPEGDRDPRA